MVRLDPVEGQCGTYSDGGGCIMPTGAAVVCRPAGAVAPGASHPPDSPTHRVHHSRPRRTPHRYPTSLHALQDGGPHLAGP